LIANNLRDNQLASVRALPQRFAQLEGNRPFVASIAITPISKGCGVRMNIMEDAPANALQGREPQEADFLAFFAPCEWLAYRLLLVCVLISSWRGHLASAFNLLLVCRLSASAWQGCKRILRNRRRS